MTYDPSGRQPDDPYQQYPDSPQYPDSASYPDSAPPQQPTSGGYYPQQPGYDMYSQPGYQQPGYQQPGYSGYQVPPTAPGFMAGQPLPQGMAVTSMVLGIVSIPMLYCCVGVILGIMAMIFGFIAINQVNRGEARGKGMALAGIILGAVAILLTLLMILLYLVMGVSGGFYDYSTY